MIDLRGKLDAFIITNGRGTFKYAERAARAQRGVIFDINIVDDMKWLEANNECVKMCKSEFFLRIDDDMVLHPLSLLFIHDQMQTLPDDTAMMFWKLWDAWKDRWVNSIKIYRKRAVEDIGFRISKIGKIDKCFKEDVGNSKYCIRANKSILGIHACSNSKEHIRYAMMRGENKGENFEAKRARLKGIDGYNFSLKQQYKMATAKGDKIEKVNREGRTAFHTIIVNEQKP